MNIERINTYEDGRFQKAVLEQHGAFLVDGVPWEFLITGLRTAQVTSPGGGPPPEELLEEFRFYTEHITRFVDGQGRLLREYPPVKLFPVSISEIQPSQFFADEEKLRAVAGFVKTGEDVVVPLLREEGTGRYISLDGHTRLCKALELGLETVYGFLTQSGDYLADFVAEAKRRGVFGVKDIQYLPHSQYELRWDRFCDAFFAEKKS